LTANDSPTEPVVVRYAPRDRDVGAVVEEPREDLGAVADVKRDVELGVRVAERADQRRHEMVAGRRDRADPQRRAAALGRLARRPLALLEQPQHVRRIRRERRAPIRRPQTAPVTLDQLDAHLALQRRDRRGNRRLRDEQLVGGSGHRPAAHHGQERRQLRQRDGHALACAAPPPAWRSPCSGISACRRPPRPARSPRR
jgi:hypothetical protein